MEKKPTKQVDSMEELVTNGEQELHRIADTGNSVAQEWLAKLQSETLATKALSLFGEMRIALMQDSRPEARAVEREMFPE